MNNFYWKQILVVGLSTLALVMTACDPAEETNSNATSPTDTTSQTKDVSQVTEKTRSDTTSPAEVVAQVEAITPPKTATEPESIVTQFRNFKASPATETETTSSGFYLSQYRADLWEIAIVEGPQGFSYYGCNTGDGLEDPCIVLTGGTSTCGGDICLFEWTSGEITYQAEISEMRRRLLVSQGETVLLEVPTLEAFYPSGDDIPADRETVTGISEDQLATIANQIYRAVYAEDWQAIAALSTETIFFNKPNAEVTSEIGRQDIVVALNNSDLEQWQARIMTSRLNDLLLNQDGAMFGGGSLWVSEILGEENPQIYSINVW